MAVGLFIWDFLGAIWGIKAGRSIRLNMSIKRVEYAHSLSYQDRMRAIEPLVPVESPSIVAECGFFL
jgi:hypothetical protein